MTNNPYSEYNASQKPALELLQSMGYIYLSPEDCLAQRGSWYDVLLRDVLRGQLRRLNSYTYGGVTNEFSAANIERAIEDLNQPLTDGLVRTSEKIYDALLLGRSYSEPVGEGRLLSFNLNYIDWEHPENNLFHVTKEFAVESADKEHNARPDLVLFLNGIPIAVIECKAPDISVEQGISQMVRNQKKEYIPQLFKFSQILLSTNKNVVKYGTTNTPRKFWNIWREESTGIPPYPPFDKGGRGFTSLVKGRGTVEDGGGISPTEQDKTLISLLHPNRVMELIRYFILFDIGDKKICRYQQYFAIREIMDTIQKRDVDGNRQGGVVWHTQGSGKSLTMVMLAKYILHELGEAHPRVVLVTDRKELDEQIANTFSHTRLHPARAISGRHLVELLDSDRADIVTTIINKFNTAERLDSKNQSKDIFVLVDESHRTNYGQLSTKMHAVFPNACFIGFTSTPLMKGDKSTLTKFGRLIHKYTIKDAVDDGTIVPLIYEGRFVDQKVDEENIDLWFEEITTHLTEAQKQDLKQKWSSIRHLTSTDARIKRIALDIKRHYCKNIQQTGFRAMLATNRKKDAIRYLNCFEKLGDLTAAVVISPPDMREGNNEVDEATDDLVIAYWKKMMERYGDGDRYEQAMKNQFCLGEIDVLIVCSKLLTGFDAPVCQILYIDKELKEHGLLQAIARTNRLRDGKDYGLIVDYRGLIKKLDDAMEVYSGAGLEGFEAGDLKGTVVDVITAVSALREASSHLEGLFQTLRNPADAQAIEDDLADKGKREGFYNLLSKFCRTLNLVLGSESTYSAMDRDELAGYQKRFVFFAKIRRAAKIRYCDAIDNREYEPLMQNLLDAHLSVKGMYQLTPPVDILDRDALEEELKELGSLRAKADAIVSRMTRSISEKHDENPAYYDSFSKRIQEMLEAYKHSAVTEAEYLAKMRDIMDDYAKGKSTVTYPEVLKGNLEAQAFYGVLAAIWSEVPEVNQDLLPEITLEITKIIQIHSKVDFTSNKTIHDRIAQDIDDLFYRYEKEQGLHFSFDLIDKMIENVKTVFLRRYAC